MPVQIFLDNEISEGIADPRQRSFERSNINQRANFSAQFFEAVPTMWANAYELESLLDIYVNPPVGARINEETQRAVDEWLCLFLLFYSGEANFEITSADDGRLWAAMRGTFPKGDGLNNVALLRMEGGGAATVVAASYPDIVFFPSRSRAAWAHNALLREYLADGRLSWELCREKLLRETQDQNDFAAFLANVKATIGGPPGEAIAKFAAVKGLTLPPGGRAFNDPRPYHPGSGWNRAIEEDMDKIMAAYPFVKEVRDEQGNVTERVYFLVTGLADANGQHNEGLPDTDWTREPIKRGMPAPNAFYQKADANGNVRGRIFLKWAGKELEYQLRPNPAAGEMKEEAVLLQNCFMKESAWCQAPTDGAFKVHAHIKHKLTNDDQSPMLNKQAGGNSYHLAPVTEQFLAHFGRDLYRESKNQLLKLEAIERRAEDVGPENKKRPRIEWMFVFEVNERDDPQRQRQLPVKWFSEVGLKEFDTVSAAIWPPKTHKDWRLYFTYGRGSGSWRLFDENGEPADKKLKGDEFLYISGERAGTQGRPNRPASLMFHDKSGTPRGVLFLQPLTDIGGRAGNAVLGVDFGTSNTCLAYKLPGAGTAQVLKFTLTPEMVWGKTPTELPGFVPFKWHNKDFFSTVLLSDIMIHDFDQMQVTGLHPSDLFLTIDIPTLHHGLKEDLALNGFKKKWHVKSDLKWQEPPIFRDLFLSLTLLYAHAELLFTHGYGVDKCVFTFPLAFSATKKSNFERQTTAVYQRIYQMCYGGPLPPAPEFLSESAAVAASQGPQNSFDLFIDIGGGSTDVALTHRTADAVFFALDSVEVAGKEFFEFVWDHFNGAQDSNKQLRRDLNQILFGKNQELTITDENQAYLREIGGFGYFYSFLISERAAADLEVAEQKVREAAHDYYQHFRSQMFYQHILTYALVQVCAAVSTNPSLPRFVRILCTGNGWGMLTFAKWDKTQTHLTALANNILTSIKGALESRLTETEHKERISKLGISDVVFLGQPNTGQGDQVRYTAKTAVACGAVDANIQMAAAGAQNNSDGNTASCYAGITLGNVRVGDGGGSHVSVPVNWNDRWVFKKFSEPLQKETSEIMAPTQINNFQFHASDSGEPPDTLLKLFFNTHKLDETWVTQKWHDLNAVMLDQREYTAQNYKMPPSPLNRFLAEALYGNRRPVLGELAQKRGKS